MTPDLLAESLHILAEENDQAIDSENGKIGRFKDGAPVGEKFFIRYFLLLFFITFFLASLTMRSIVVKPVWREMWMNFAATLLELPSVQNLNCFDFQQSNTTHSPNLPTLLTLFSEVLINECRA